MVSTQRTSVSGDAQATEQLIEVATSFYRYGRSQVEIARELGLDPSTVSRYLKRARDEGIVHIEIRSPRREHVDLGRDLAGRYGLHKAIVVPEQAEAGDALYAVAADFISSSLMTGMRVGISWGQTLAGTVRFLQPRSVSGLSIAQLTGGLSDAEPGNQGHELVRHLAELYPNSQVKYLHAPAIVDSEAIREAMVADRSVSAALKAAARSEFALVGIGSMGEDATLIRVGHLDAADRVRVLASGAIGTLNGRFFDARGRPAGHLERRTIALTWDQLAAIPTVVAVAAGETKVDAIAGALETGCLDVLVTDESTARSLIRRKDR
jgi:DNA-binding transcriptional regulator LsrR (DeoR family)